MSFKSYTMLVNKNLRVTLFHLLVCVYLASGQITLPSQCYTYSTINDPSRSVTADVGSNQCDASFTPDNTWYRFVGNGGTQIPTTSTPPNQCGTQVTGWYAGSMPAISETVNNGQVCFAWNNNPCRWSNTIGVTNCGSFYVYRLTLPPVCAARYCTETVVVPTTPAPVIPFQCTNYTENSDATRSKNYTGSIATCDQTTFSRAQWVRFTGSSGDIIPTSAVPDNRCGTHAAGWYSSEMPTNSFTTVNGTVCFSWSGNTCNWRSNIQVTNCGSYYVYYLTTPSVCQLRYCTENSQN